MSVSFLANDISQMPLPNAYGNNSIEAISFNRDDLTDEKWDLVWKNIKLACKTYSSENVTYHFPINNSDYVEDGWVFEKLVDAYRRAINFGLSGVVVHSNRIKTFDEWKSLDISVERNKVLEKLNNLVKIINNTSSTWLALENMPIVGNSGYDIDPIFCFVKDFSQLPEGIGIVWDVCHAVSTVEYLHAHKNSRLKEDLVLRTCNDEYFDFTSIRNKIRHYHFAGIRGINDPGSKTICIEGILPAESSVPEIIYKKFIKLISEGSFERTINFEIQEDNYYKRENAPKIMEWVKKCLANN